MRFCSLGSGSTGNASLIESQDGQRSTRVLLDCGFSQRELAHRLGRAGVTVDQIDAIFITHEHGDHVGCAVGLARRHGIALWMSRGTWRAVSRTNAVPESLFTPQEEEEICADNAQLHFARDGEAIDFQGLRLMPYTVPHDANEPLQAVFDNGRTRLGVLTDAGCSTAHLLAHLSHCDALLLECNHDTDLLARSAYPASLKARIGGRLGHLSNGTAGEILASVKHGGLRHVVAAHLSERNNTTLLAQAALARPIGAALDDIQVADPKLGTVWFDMT